MLVWKDEWLRLTLPAARAFGGVNAEALAASVSRIIEVAPETPRHVVSPKDDLGLFVVGLPDGAGFYADRHGEMVVSWTSPWARPELWLFDLHHHLLMGKPGEVAAGVTSLIGIAFLITGIILWLRTWRRFSLRVWPKRFSRGEIIRHHRDLGIVATPLLFIAMATGVMLTLRPVAGLVLSPLNSPAEMRAALAPPQVAGGDAGSVDWNEILATAQSRFPDGEIRLVRPAAKSGDLVNVRVKQPYEWLPNGRTLLWFDPATSALIDAREASEHPAGVQVQNSMYPLHAAKVGGLAYKIAMTLTGLALAMLGAFTVWTFWRRQAKRRLRRRTIAGSSGRVQPDRSSARFPGWRNLKSLRTRLRPRQHGR